MNSYLKQWTGCVIHISRLVSYMCTLLSLTSVLFPGGNNREEKVLWASQETDCRTGFQAEQHLLSFPIVCLLTFLRRLNLLTMPAASQDLLLTNNMISWTPSMLSRCVVLLVSVPDYCAIHPFTASQNMHVSRTTGAEYEQRMKDNATTGVWSSVCCVVSPDTTI